MICDFCGKELPEGSAFCFYCGGKQEAAGQVTETAQQQTYQQQVPPQMQAQPQSYQQPQQQQQTGGGNRTVLIAGICCGLVVLAALILLIVTVVTRSGKNGDTVAKKDRTSGGRSVTTEAEEEEEEEEEENRQEEEQEREEQEGEEEGSGQQEPEPEPALPPMTELEPEEGFLFDVPTIPGGYEFHDNILFANVRIGERKESTMYILSIDRETEGRWYLDLMGEGKLTGGWIIPLSEGSGWEYVLYDDNDTFVCYARKVLILEDTQPDRGWHVYELVVGDDSSSVTLAKVPGY